MTEKRKVEVLEMLKEEIETAKYKDMCSSLAGLYRDGKLTTEERIIIDRLIYENMHFYEYRSESPRVKFLNRLIKEAKGEGE